MPPCYALIHMNRTKEPTDSCIAQSIMILDLVYYDYVRIIRVTYVRTRVLSTTMHVHTDTVRTESFDACVAQAACWVPSEPTVVVASVYSTSSKYIRRGSWSNQSMCAGDFFIFFLPLHDGGILTKATEDKEASRMQSNRHGHRQELEHLTTPPTYITHPIRPWRHY